MSYVPSFFYTFVGYKQINTDSIESCEFEFNKIHILQKHFKASEYSLMNFKASEYLPGYKEYKENKFYFDKIYKYVKKYFKKYSEYISFDSNKIEYDIFVDILMYFIRYYENNTIIKNKLITNAHCKCSNPIFCECKFIVTYERFYNNSPDKRYNRLIKHIESESVKIFKYYMYKYMVLME